MRFISFHINYFRYKVTKKDRSGIIEELPEKNKEEQINDALILFISIEKQDEDNAEIIDNSIREIEKISKQLKVSNIVLLPFAHLFGKLSTLDFAFESLKKLEKILKDKEYFVIRMPFGWFSELEMKAKGHPLSRISRIIN